MTFIQLGQIHPQIPLVLTSPHSGERIPKETPWLEKLRHESPLVFLRDVDRFVTELYRPGVTSLSLPLLATEIHRYAADLNRYPEDVDQDSVIGAKEQSGTHPKGFHWVFTTRGERVLEHPISADLHSQLVELYHDAFHAQFAELLKEVRGRFPHSPLFHLDCHSMPSVGTAAHQDQGQTRPDVVVSDQGGKSASADFKDAVIAALKKQGLEVGYNWPYQGGRLTQRYGKPEEGHETIQIELNRALYMNEATKEKTENFPRLQMLLEQALREIEAFLLGR